jgi:hypothetical protein
MGKLFNFICGDFLELVKISSLANIEMNSVKTAK